MNLSRTKISSFVGDVRPLYLMADTDLSQADITWQVSGNAAILRSFANDPLSSFRNGVLVSLKEAGSATVTATYEGTTYSCLVTARERRVAAPEDAIFHYRGDLHTHTTNIHNPDAFIARTEGFQIDYLNQIKEENLLDFAIISDHADVMRKAGFFEAFTHKEMADPLEIVVFPGSESEVSLMEKDRFGLTHKHSGEIVILNADNCSDAANWEQFDHDLAQSILPIATFAHPHVLGSGQTGIWNFQFDKISTPARRKIFQGIEMGDGSGRGIELLYEPCISLALDSGFSVSTTCSSDGHGPIWSFSKHPGKTIIMAPEKSREAFLDALLNNRFYASESANVKFRGTVNGTIIPARLSPVDSYAFHIELGYFQEDHSTRPVKCQVISDYGTCLLTLTDFNDASFDFEIKSNTARYFYLRLVDEKGRKTWSPPVFTGRAFDAPSEEVSYIPLDSSNFHAWDTVTGADASAVLDGDPGVAFDSTATTASIVIDLQQAQHVCALGHYAKRFTKDWIKETESKSTEIGKTFVCRYAISTSMDGVQFTQCAAGKIRVFGDEQILSFPAHEARYIRFDALSTMGKESDRPELADSPVTIGELSVFTDR